jgi:hypothetical protein
MRLLIFIAGMLLALSGCATRGFAKEGATVQDFYKDLQGCDAETKKSGSWCWGNECDRQRSAQKDRRNLCMKSRGWDITRDENAFRE